MLRLWKYLLLKSKDDVKRIYMMDNIPCNVSKKYPKDKKYKYIVRVETQSGSNHDIGFGNHDEALKCMDELEATLKDA